TTIPSFLPANYTVTFSESAKINGDNLISFARPELGAGAKDEIQSFGVTLFTGSNQSDVVADGNVAVFNDIYTTAIDKYDSKKITASGENFDLKRNGTLLVIEARTSLTARDTLFYNMSKLAKKTYQLRFVADNLEQTGLTPVLIDKYLNTRTTLSISGNSSVNITVNNDAASALANRFMVVFAPQNVLPVTFVNIQAARKDSGIMVTWNIENEKNIRNYDIEKSTDGINFNTIGKVASRNLSNYTMLDRSAGTTACYYRISALSVDGEIKKSGIAKVNSIETNTLISVYPNPVKDNNIQLRFGGRESANYIIRLINTDGKILFAKAIQHKTGTIIESIKPEMTIAHGIYQLEIAKQDGNVTVLQVMF
ncbi:MAG: T9SS type A sorting domain-containing protein, partial [Ginsengibacter sp.]